MSPILQMFLSAFLKYLESHPEQIEALVAAGVDFLVKELAKAKSPASAT